MTTFDAVDFHALLNTIQEFIVVKDGLGRILFCNETALAAYDLLGYEYSGQTDLELMHARPDHAQAFRHNIETDEIAWNNRMATTLEKTHISPNGQINSWEVIKTPYFDVSGKRQRLVIVSRNVTERKQAENALKASEERLRGLAYEDALTKIPNRRGILDQISARLVSQDSSDPGNHPSALLYMDIDRFKFINDQYGHEVGDTLLTAFASKARQHLRTCDLFGRVGGDEFIAFLENTARRPALLIAQRLSEAINCLWELQGHSIFSSSSIGVAFTQEAGGDIHALLRHADSALYEAKRHGRARVMEYSHKP